MSLALRRIAGTALALGALAALPPSGECAHRGADNVPCPPGSLTKVPDANRFPSIDPLASQVYQVAGGQSSRGPGGSGKACFRTAAEAGRALDPRTQALRPEYKARVQSVWTLELWDLVDFAEIIEPAEGDTPESYLRAIIRDDIRPLSGAFADNLDEALRGLRSPEEAAWIDAGSIPYIPDQGPAITRRSPAASTFRHPDPSLCVPVQLVERFQAHRDGAFPATEVRYDRVLYEVMRRSPDGRAGIANQAMLRLHEALYAMGVDLGQSDSAASRALNQLLLSPGLYRDLARLPARLRGFAFRNRLNRIGFDREPYIFIPKLDPSSAAAYTRSSLQASYLTFMEKYRPVQLEAARDLRARGREDVVDFVFGFDPVTMRTPVMSPLDPRLIEYQSEEGVIAQRQLYPRLSDPEAFLRFAVIEEAPRGIVDLDTLLFAPAPSASEAVDAEVRKVCADAEHLGDLSSWRSPIAPEMRSYVETQASARLEPVRRYCREWRRRH